jgi:hypothetical protein
MIPGKSRLKPKTAFLIADGFETRRYAVIVRLQRPCLSKFYCLVRNAFRTDGAFFHSDGFKTRRLSGNFVRQF